MAQPNSTSSPTWRRAFVLMRRRVAASSSTAARAIRRNVVPAGPSVSNSPTATAAPSWIETIDTISNPGGGTAAAARAKGPAMRCGDGASGDAFGSWADGDTAPSCPLTSSTHGRHATTCGGLPQEQCRRDRSRRSRAGEPRSPWIAGDVWSSPSWLPRPLGFPALGPLTGARRMGHHQVASAGEACHGQAETKRSFRRSTVIGLRRRRVVVGFECCGRGLVGLGLD